MNLDKLSVPAAPKARITGLKSCAINLFRYEISFKIHGAKLIKMRPCRVKGEW